MTSNLITTIEDLEKLYYSQNGMNFLAQSDIVAPFLTKADAPVLSTTTGVYNAVYGSQAWVQLNQEANTFGVLPKLPWTRSGWRVITARSTTLPYGGQAESGALPDTIKPTWAEVSTKPKISAVTFDNSEVQEFLAKSGDDAIGAMADLRDYFAVEHKEDLNKQLNTENGTLAGYNFESIDRVVSSYSEITNCTQAANGAYTTGDVDIYSQDRDGAAGWTDAYVGHNSGTDRSLTDTLIQSLVQNTLLYGANPAGQFFQTGYDTWAAINQLYETQVRYNILGETKISVGVNGISSQKGNDVAMSVASILGRPVIQSKDTVQETGGISRLYLLDISNPEGKDFPRLGLKIAKPTQYFEAGMNTDTPFAVNKFGTEGMYRTMGELICTFFAVQGKLRDLKA